MTTHSCIFPSAGQTTLPALVPPSTGWHKIYTPVSTHCQTSALNPLMKQAMTTPLYLPFAWSVDQTHCQSMNWHVQAEDENTSVSTLSWVMSTHRWSRGWWHSFCLPSALGVCHSLPALVPPRQLHSHIYPLPGVWGHPTSETEDNNTPVSTLYGVWGHPTSEEEDELLMYLPSTWSWVRPTQSLNWSVQREDDNTPVCTYPV